MGDQRLSPSELSVYVQRAGVSFNFLSYWNEYTNPVQGILEIIGLTGFDVAERDKLQAFEILSALSVDISCGAFIWCPRYNQPVFRYGFLSTDCSMITHDQLNFVTAEALAGAKKLHQALKILFIEGKTSKEAIFRALLEVKGEA